MLDEVFDISPEFQTVNEYDGSSSSNDISMEDGIYSKNSISGIYMVNELI